MPRLRPASEAACFYFAALLAYRYRFRPWWGMGAAVAVSCVQGVISLPMFSKAVCMHALKGLALLRVSHNGDIALAGSRRKRSTHVAAQVHFAHAVVTATKNGIHRIISPLCVLVMRGCRLEHSSYGACASFWL